MRFLQVIQAVAPARRRWRALAAALLLAPLAAQAAEPVRHIGIYVEPFYRAADAPDKAPQVSVGQTFNGLLASTRREDILAARDLITGNPNKITPMTLMVLAIRFYDVGLRDDAVFWFYAAKDRYLTFADVVDINMPQLADANSAIGSFAALAGPVINGYAFCDLANQKTIRAKALDWVEANTYEVMFLPQLAARTGDRKAALALALRNARANAEKERAYFDDPRNVESFFATRKKNEADVKFCWR